MPKQNIIMCKGLPASGKSTWAKDFLLNHTNFVRVNNDEITAMLYNKQYVKNRKPLRAIRESMEEAVLRSGMSLISDNTNLREDHQTRYEFLANMFDAGFVIQDFTNISVNECLARNKKREQPVNEEAILDMFRHMIRGVKKPEFVVGLPSAIICDLDGTLALHNGKRGPYEDDKCEIDDINPAVLSMLKDFKINISDRRIIFISGRDEGRSRTPTVRWLREKCNLYKESSNDRLYMRPAGDIRPDWQVKKEIYMREIRGLYNITAVFDDRDQVVREWRQLGLPTFQVNYGAF